MPGNETRVTGGLIPRLFVGGEVPGNETRVTGLTPRLVVGGEMPGNETRVTGALPVNPLYSQGANQTRFRPDED